MNVAFVTLGCKVNTYETEAIWELLQDRGYQRVDRMEDADYVVINTCMVTQVAEGKSKQMIRRAITKNPHTQVVVMGCLSQMEKETIAQIPGVIIIVGTKDREQIPDLLDLYRRDPQPLILNSSYMKQEPYDALSLQKFQIHQRAFLKIQDGCDQFCSYCIIPYTRGRVRSKPLEVVLEEADALAKMHPEIVLTGIHTGAYGRDLEHIDLTTLIRRLIEHPNMPRLRISSIEVIEITDDLIKMLSDSNPLVPHLHIPLQSGSDSILKRMNRPYSAADYLKRIEEIRKRLPGIAITTDIIVGFPGETEHDFQASCTLARLARFSEMHIFPYSKRKGTQAEHFTDEVPHDIKKRRVHELIALNQRLAQDYIQSKKASKLQVVVEQYRSGMLIGHSREYIHIQFPGPKEYIGREVDVDLVHEEYPLSLGRLI